MIDRNTRKSDRQKIVRLVETSPRLQAVSCNAVEAAAQLQYAEKPAGRKGLQPGLKGWLDRVLLPIILKELEDLRNDTSGEFTSRGFRDALRYLRALFFKPAVA